MEHDTIISMRFVFTNDISPREVVNHLHRALDANGLTSIRLWLDDDLVDRPAPEGWVHVTTVQQANALLTTGRVVELSLDNDLGNDDLYGIGLHVVDFICEKQVVAGWDLWPTGGITLHTANAQARDYMTLAIMRYASELHGVHQALNSSGKRTFAFC